MSAAIIQLVDPTLQSAFAVLRRMRELDGECADDYGASRVRPLELNDYSIAHAKYAASRSHDYDWVLSESDDELDALDDDDDDADDDAAAIDARKRKLTCSTSVSRSSTSSDDSDGATTIAAFELAGGDEARDDARACVSLRGRATWSWYMGWKVRSYRERWRARFSPEHFGDFDFVPDEIWLHILSFLPYQSDIEEVRLVNRNLHRICGDRTLTVAFGLRKLTRAERAQFSPQACNVNCNLVMVGDHDVPVAGLANAFLFETAASTGKKALGFGTTVFRFNASRHGQPEHVALSLFNMVDAAAPKTQRRMLPFSMLCDCIGICFNAHSRESLDGTERWLQQALETTRKERLRLGLQPKPVVCLLGVPPLYEADANKQISSVDVASKARQLANKFGAVVRARVLDVGYVLSAIGAEPQVRHGPSIDDAFLAIINLARENDPHVRKQMHNLAAMKQ